MPAPRSSPAAPVLGPPRRSAHRAAGQAGRHPATAPPPRGRPPGSRSRPCSRCRRAKVGVDPQTAARAVIAGWRSGHLKALRLDGLTAEEALALERSARRPLGPPDRPGASALALLAQRTPTRQSLPVAPDTPVAGVSTVGGSTSPRTPAVRSFSQSEGPLVTADTAAVDGLDTCQLTACPRWAGPDRRLLPQLCAAAATRRAVKHKWLRRRTSGATESRTFALDGWASPRRLHHDSRGRSGGQHAGGDIPRLSAVKQQRWVATVPKASAQLGWAHPW
jgi:hypothetical protein